MSAKKITTIEKVKDVIRDLYTKVDNDMRVGEKYAYCKGLILGLHIGKVFSADEVYELNEYNNSLVGLHRHDDNDE